MTVVNAPAAKVPGQPAMFIQAGVFADHENARRRVEVLLAAGLELASLDEMPGTTARCIACASARSPASRNSTST